MEFLGYVATNEHYLRRQAPPAPSNANVVTSTSQHKISRFRNHKRARSSESLNGTSFYTNPRPNSEAGNVFGQPDKSHTSQGLSLKQTQPHKTASPPLETLPFASSLSPEASFADSPGFNGESTAAIIHALSVPSSPTFDPTGHPIAALGARIEYQSHAAMLPEPGLFNIFPTSLNSNTASAAAVPILSSGRNEGASSNPGDALPASAEAGASSLQSLLSASTYQAKPFVVRNGRTYLSDPSLPYPLPVDLAELHRQFLRTLLLFQLFGGPVCSPALLSNPPTRVLEVGCGSGFWSTMCNQFYRRQGHHGISFTGLDIANIGHSANNAGGQSRPRHGDSSSSSALPTFGLANGQGKDDMNWRFVQHDIRRMPWPFTSEEFDLVMVKDMSLAVRTEMYQLLIDECIRLLRPGGTLEIWDSDYTIRLLRPHVPPSPTSSEAQAASEIISKTGAYVMTANTPLSAPLNNFLVEYNAWLVKAFEARAVPYVPCSLAGAMFLQETESLVGAGSRRLAIPLSEVKWEREGVGGVVTKDGKSYVETKSKGRQNQKTITPAQSALRHTALLTVVQMIQSLEPILREVNGKSQDEWDSWASKMMNDLIKDNGTSWGECLEVGAWWARKK